MLSSHQFFGFINQGKHLSNLSFPPVLWSDVGFHNAKAGTAFVAFVLLTFIFNYAVTLP